VYLLSISKTEIKYKINIIRDNFYTFNVFNARVLR
jgi:hypothetical protein